MDTFWSWRTQIYPVQTSHHRRPVHLTPGRALHCTVPATVRNMVFGQKFWPEKVLVVVLQNSALCIEEVHTSNHHHER